MGKRDTAESPLEAIAGVAGREAAEAFELLANDTRLAILLALWDAYEPFEGGSGLTFSELRDRVGMRDSGQFNYHLGKLEGRFVKSSDEGYHLRLEGFKITRAIIAGIAVQGRTLEPTELGIPCPRCGGATAITYQSSRLYQVCTQCEGYFGETDEFPVGTLFGWRLDPAGLANRTAEEIYTATTIGMLHRSLAMVEGVCPECSGAVDLDLQVCSNHELESENVCHTCGRADQVVAHYRCTVCKNSSVAAPSDLISQHPAVIAFYYDHGVDFQFDLDFQGVTRVLELGDAHQQTLESTDPIRVRVDIRYEGDELSLVLDEQMSVIEVVN